MVVSSGPLAISHNILQEANQNEVFPTPLLAKEKIEKQKIAVDPDQPGEKRVKKGDKPGKKTFDASWI